MKPLTTNNFGLLQHKQQIFVAYTPTGLSNDGLTDPNLWTHVRPQLRIGDEIKCIAEDYSYAALLIVTHHNGQAVKTKLIWRAELDSVEDLPEKLEEPYFIKQRGVKKWCIMSRETGEPVIENIDTQIMALRSLEDYNKALAS